jgi:Tol biopolymer transport system component
MVLVRDGRARRIDTRNGPNAPAAYSSWHPNGKLVAFSRNSIVQMFHSAGVETREVIDRDSDLALYDVETGKSFTVPQISRPDWLETFPAWSPDGKYLYFCSARLLWTDKKDGALKEYDKIQYDLSRISYDAATGQWGQVETVVAASQFGKSISLPQISPDGRYVMFCGHPYGAFPIFQPGTDLYLLDLRSGKTSPRRLDEIDSDRTDSYHTWSSNGRWVVFSSKREDGIFARLYMAHLGESGRFGKPFVLPQQDPDFYGRCLMTYNRPELIQEPVAVSAAELTRAINAPSGSDARPGGSPAPGDAPWQPLK